MGLKRAYRRPRTTQMAGLIRNGGRHYRCSGYTLVSLWFYALHKWLVSYCCHDQRQRMNIFGTSDRA